MKTELTTSNQPLPLKEKIGYALGDGAANIAWRGVATFLLIFYTDVFGIAPAVVGVLMLVARSSDGLSDVFMGIIGDRTESKYGKFRPWILWTAIPLGAILALLFTTPDLNDDGKVIYAYVTYILFTLIYTANNIPYGALMAVMTGNDKERTSLGSFRMVGAFTGGMVVQGALLYLVATFGNVSPTIQLKQKTVDSYLVTVSAPNDVPNANIKTENGIATFQWVDANIEDQSITPSKSFLMEADFEYTFAVNGEENLTKESFSIINQKKGYSTAIYIMSVFLTLFMFVTFYSTKERIAPPKSQKTDLKKDFLDLINNKPWLILLIIGLLFNIYNSIKQGIVVIYFTHYLNDQLLAASYMIGLTIASIGGAMATASLGKKYGKKKLFIYALLLSALFNALLIFCGTTDISAIFTLGIISEFASAILPTLFFAMLGDAADYSEYTNGRRATGLIYSAGSFATKFGGGIAAAIIGFVLSAYHYDGLDHTTIEGAIPGIKILMSWAPALVALVGAGLMTFYPLNDFFLQKINVELNKRRETEGNNSHENVLEKAL
ncbi:MFS transporter [Flammeovirga sp. SJP92]|uniref:MFS transporter n=1 Tax=Flammeovirga sp. SJP92 TaxID=1775430 RepID=UPI0007897C6D|nr:MFS transporter [Flammeovirga sp. SJP92]KXX70564.1 MFS transporter [Flammeovirga sp. SJP92]